MGVLYLRVSPALFCVIFIDGVGEIRTGLNVRIFERASRPYKLGISGPASKCTMSCVLFPEYDMFFCNNFIEACVPSFLQAPLCRTK